MCRDVWREERGRERKVAIGRRLRGEQDLYVFGWLL